MDRVNNFFTFKVLSGFVLAGTVLLGGCQSESASKAVPLVPTTTPVTIPSQPAPAVNRPAVNTGSDSSADISANNRGSLNICQSELATLQKVSPKTYAAKKAQFENLLRTASLYTTVRGDINGSTKETLDALYKYKTNQICSSIANAVMEGLIRKGESIK
ncbi:hypothetical protein [Entomohabitans teleogrylli]|uniref:hypothetical protein n=1 Tax=Entomohabitans teleogrylli TaxID=1384589 RepID=UPI00073D9F52|nr:hypothetical protein [Entomohabitans teleogrylli]